MRRLLAFGTGAAIIGLVLLLVAFYESYIIVSQLQREIAEQGTTDVNLLLEDATLEAIFLGVMVALGYGLVSQGFSGIRRQELLDLEGTADDEITKARVMAKIERERATERVRPKGLRMPAAPMPAKEPTKTSPPPSPFTSFPAASSGSPSKEPTKAETTNASTSSRAAPQPMVVAETTSSSEVEETTSSPQVLSSAEPEPVPKGPEPIVEVPKVEEATVSAPEIDTEGQQEPAPAPAVVWEGGPPPALEGVDALPERPDSATMVDAPAVSTHAEQTAGSEHVDVAAKPKRGRGRPKGSKSSKKKADEGT